MTKTDWISLGGAIGQVAAALIAVGALIAALVQLSRMREQLRQDAAHNRTAHQDTQQQLKDSREFAEAQAKLFVFEYLEGPENLRLRRAAGKLGRTPKERWDDDQVEQANLLSGMWEVVATLVKANVVPESFVKELYGGAICRHWDLLEDRVMSLRIETGQPEQRVTFEQLACKFNNVVP